MKVTVKHDPTNIKIGHGIYLDIVYSVIGIEADYYRIVNDNNEPVLYPPEWFHVINNTEPEEWVTTYGEDGERYSYPPEIGHPGFFEDWHDDINEARSIFEKWLSSRKD